MPDKTYTVTATLGDNTLDFEDVEAPNKDEAISEAQSQLYVNDWDFMDTEVSIESESEAVSVPLCDLFGQDLLDLIIEKFVEEAEWTAKRVKA